MPKRGPSQEDTALILAQARKRSEHRKAAEWFKQLTGRDIYDMATLNLMNRIIIDRPVRLALHGTVIEPDTSISPIEVMTNALVDGYAIIRLGPGWEFLTPFSFDYVKKLKLDGRGFVEFMRIEYLFETSEGDRWFRREYYKTIELGPRGNVIGERAYRQDYETARNVEDLDRAKALPVIEIEFIPFAIFPWTKMESFFVAVKLAIIHVENVAHEISGENIRHHKRKLFVKLPQKTKVELTDLHDDINLLTSDGDAFYPDPHSAAVVSFFREKGDIIEAIENATGVIATEKIVALSGVSRMWAMKSLADLAKDIRDVFTAGMIRIETIFQRADSTTAKKLQIQYQTIAMPVADPVQQHELLKLAREDNHIDDHEFRSAVRTMLSV